MDQKKKISLWKFLGTLVSLFSFISAVVAGCLFVTEMYSTMKIINNGVKGCDLNTCLQFDGYVDGKWLKWGVPKEFPLMGFSVQRHSIKTDGAQVIIICKNTMESDTIINRMKYLTNQDNILTCSEYIE